VACAHTHTPRSWRKSHPPIPGIAIRKWFVRLMGAESPDMVSDFSGCHANENLKPAWFGCGAICGFTTMRRLSAALAATLQQACIVSLSSTGHSGQACRGGPAGRVHPRIAGRTGCKSALLAGQSGCRLIVRTAWPRRRIPALANAWCVQAVFAAQDYESPVHRARMHRASEALAKQRHCLLPVKDHVIFEEPRSADPKSGKPYGVFTPYMRAWLARLGRCPTDYSAMSAHRRRASWPTRRRRCSAGVPTLGPTGFQAHEPAIAGNPHREHPVRPDCSRTSGTLDDYDRTRELSCGQRDPAIWVCTCALARSRFATGAPGTATQACRQQRCAAVWLGRTGLARFYFQVLANFPICGQHGAFKPEYDHSSGSRVIVRKRFFSAWCEGRPATRWWMPPWPSSTRPATCTTACAWWQAVFWSNTWALTGAGASATLQKSSTTLTCRPTTAAGSGSAPAAATPSPTSASSTPSRRAKSSTPGQVHPALPSGNYQSLGNKAIHAPWLAKPVELAAAGLSWDAITRCRSLTMPPMRALLTLQRYGVVRKAAPQSTQQLLRSSCAPGPAIRLPNRVCRGNGRHPVPWRVRDVYRQYVT
jgi:deoxyribodipyrimidine photo-lyase